MNKKSVQWMLVISALIILVILIAQPVSIYQFREEISILFPKGSIALEERNLLFIMQAAMLLVIVPVYVLTFVFCWKYRAGNPKAKYEPDLVDSKLAEYIWWGFPFIMTAIISVLTWVKTNELDPYKPIASEKKTLTIQVVALQWKWLFLYPEEGIATLNFFQIPKDTPVHFEITADAPMNSFWIPDLGGQIYAMPSMRTELHLIANELGEFRGSSANLSGEGFADMHFMVTAKDESNFKEWIQTVKNSSKILDKNTYDQLAIPSTEGQEIYQLEDQTLFNQILMKYMHPEKKDSF